jgi:hypothetical protein
MVNDMENKIVVEGLVISLDGIEEVNGEELQFLLVDRDDLLFQRSISKYSKPPLSSKK